DALDLCLECKACKSECPTNLDLARLKAEFLHHYHRAHGLPWRNRLFGHVARLSRLGSRWAPWSNRLAQSRWLRAVNEWCFGIDRRRVPPAVVREPFVTAFRRAAAETLERNYARQVVLFPDT